MFRDIDNIPLGVDFREYISTTLAETDVTLVVLGKRWFGARRGHRRIDDPDDPVRVEVETALRSGMPVFPVLVEGSGLPKADQLPDGLKDLIYRNGLDVHSGLDFDQHIERLFRNIDSIFAEIEQRQGEGARQAEEEQRAEATRRAEEEHREANTTRAAEEERQWAEAASHAEEERQQFEAVPQMSATPDSSLADSSRIIAVLRRELEECKAELGAALAREAATAEVLQVINSSPGDLAPVFDAMLEKAMRLCGASFGFLDTYDGERFRTAAVHGVPESFAEFRKHNPPSYGRGTMQVRLLDGERLVHVIDLTAEDAYRDGELNRRALVELGGARTALLVPLLKDEVMLGFIAAYRQEVRSFSDKQIALLQNFAAQAVIAMENGRLLGELRQRTDEVAEWNRELEARVTEQVEELGRVGRLKNFLAPQLAELIVSRGDEKILESHRREIVVAFCDLRGYAAFTETAEPEEVLDFLRRYHGALGPLVADFEGTLDQFSGNGIMVFFNDPVPIPDAAERAVEMAVAMREAASSLITAWRERGRDLGFGAGIAQGYATLGQIGFSQRSGYTAIGTVCNVAACLCAEAKDGQILLSQRVNAALRGIATEQVGALALKGLTQPVVAFNVPLVAGQAASCVIEGGAPSADQMAAMRSCCALTQ